MLASLLALGGNFNNGTNDGVFYFNCNNAFSNTNLNYGAHLLISINYCTMFSLPLGKNNVDTAVVSKPKGFESHKDR